MKKYMPLEGLRWSRDSGSTLCDTPQNGRSRTGWGDEIDDSAIEVVTICSYKYPCFKGHGGCEVICRKCY